MVQAVLTEVNHAYVRRYAGLMKTEACNSQETRLLKKKRENKRQVIYGLDHTGQPKLIIIQTCCSFF